MMISDIERIKGKESRSTTENITYIENLDMNIHFISGDPKWQVISTSLQTFTILLSFQIFVDRRITWVKCFCDTTDTYKCASLYIFELHFNQTIGEYFIKTSNLNFFVVNFPFIDNIIPEPSAYGVHFPTHSFFKSMCPMQRFSRQSLVVDTELLKQGYFAFRLTPSFQKFYRNVIQSKTQ